MGKAAKPVQQAPRALYRFMRFVPVQPNCTGISSAYVRNDSEFQCCRPDKIDRVIFNSRVMPGGLKLYC